ncbi:hypothetical protein Hanom_Chr07g00640581 [Helianthus anomalus]
MFTDDSVKEIGHDQLLYVRLFTAIFFLCTGLLRCVMMSWGRFETLLNLLLCNYSHYNLYDQAEKLRSKAPRFEAHSNQQLCLYLFYLGKIRTIQLESTDAKESLLQAARKASVAALGFRVQCNKWAVIVRLLLGEIPEQTVFMQRGMEKALRPYFELTNVSLFFNLQLYNRLGHAYEKSHCFCALCFRLGFRRHRFCTLRASYNKGCSAITEHFAWSHHIESHLS